MVRSGLVVAGPCLVVAGPCLVVAGPCLAVGTCHCRVGTVVAGQAVAIGIGYYYIQETKNDQSCYNLDLDLS